MSRLIRIPHQPLGMLLAEGPPSAGISPLSRATATFRQNIYASTVFDLISFQDYALTNFSTFGWT